MSEFQPTVDEKSIFELDPIEIKVNKPTLILRGDIIIIIIIIRIGNGCLVKG